MAKTWVFVAGAGIGYVLGTRAGREKYNAMRTQAQEFFDRPAVRETTETVQAEAARLYDEGRSVLRDRLRQLRLRTQPTAPAPRLGINGVDLE